MRIILKYNEVLKNNAGKNNDSLIRNLCPLPKGNCILEISSSFLKRSNVKW